MTSGNLCVERRSRKNTKNGVFSRNFPIPQADQTDKLGCCRDAELVAWSAPVRWECRIVMNLKRNTWRARVLMAILGTALLATGSVWAQQPAGDEPVNNLEPGFDPVFTGEQPLPKKDKPAKPGATARRMDSRVGASRPGASRPAPAGGNANGGAANAGGGNNSGPAAPANPPANNDDYYPEPPKAKVQKAIAAQNKVTKDLMAKKGVVGTATGLTEDGEVVVRVYTNGVDRPQLPQTVDGVRVEKVVVGQFRPFQGGKPQRQRRLPRPVPIGTSAIAYNEDACASGTYGARLRGARGKIYGLSNNHVFALENAGIPDFGQGVDGGATGITQPSAGDDNCPLTLIKENLIGTLRAFVEISTDLDVPNLVDAAVIVSDANVIGATTLPDGYGVPRSTNVDAFLGQRVQKYGRTTGYRDGVVSSINATALITYEPGDAAFIDQIEVIGIPDSESLGAPGDSGSLVVDMNRNPVGLLFAGGGFPVVRTLCNKIDNVISAFRISLREPTLVVDSATPTIPPGHVGVAQPGVPSSPLLPTVP